MKKNRKHKDTVFTLLFNNPDVLRELYSAIEGVDLPPDVPISINTLKNALIKGKLNDISFTIDNWLVVLIEHQSTINENMPLRLLQYIGRIYEKIIYYKKLYKKKLEKIPMPEFIVLYNGIDLFPDHAEMRLSDAFKNIESLKSDRDLKLPLELVVQVYNVNYGQNMQMLKKSETLSGYSFFIDKVREYEKSGKTLDDSIESAVKYCIKTNVLKTFLEEHGSEVVNLLYAEWNLDDALEVSREEGFEDGLEQGREKIARRMKSYGKPFSEITEITGVPIEIVENL